MNIIRYQAVDVSLEARIEDGQAWLTYEQTAELFEVDDSVIGKHARAILDAGELPVSVAARFAVTANDGKSYQKVHLNQDMVVHIGYRVRSERGIEFRRYVTSVLKAEAPAPLAKAPTLTQQLLMTAQAMVELEQRIDNSEGRIASLEAHNAKVADEVSEALALPPAPVEVSERSFGQMSVALLKAWASEHGGVFQDAHRTFYQAVLERPETRIDLRARLEFAQRNKERGKKPKRLCDVIDESGKAAEIYAIARQLFARKAA